MPDKKVLYSVKTPDGRTEQWDQQTYDELSPKLYEKYPDAQVARVSSYIPEEDDGNENDMFQVAVSDGRTESWNRKQFNELYGPLKEKYPDAQVYRVSNASDNYWNAKLKESQDALSGFETQNGEAMAQYEQALRDASKVSRNAQISPAQQYVMENREEYERLKQQRDSLGSAVFNNPVVRRGRELAVENANKRSEEYLANADSAATGEERRDWKRAAKLQRDAAELYSAPSKYDENGFSDYLKDYWAGAKNTFSDRDFWTRGLTQITRDFDLYGIRRKVAEAEKAKGGELEESDYDRILTPGEKAELFAAYNLAYAQADDVIGRAKDLPSAYRSGTSAAESVGFMAEFLLGTEIMNATGKAILKGSKSAMAKWLGEALMSDKAIDGAIKKGLLDEVKRSSLKELGHSAAQSLVKGVGHTAAQPLGLVSNIAQKMNETDDEGELNTIWEGVGLGLADTLIENWSESFGQTIDTGFEVIGKGVGKLGRAKAKTDFGKLARWAMNSNFSKTLTEAGFNGFLGEMLEEWAGNAVRLATPLMDKEEFNRFASIQQQLEMAASFAPMTLIGLAGSTAGAALEAKKFGKLSETVKNILLKNGVSQQEIEDALSEREWASSEDIAEHLAPYALRVLNNGGEDAQGDYKTILDFAGQFGKEAFLNEVKATRDQEDRNQMQTGIVEATGENFWVDIPDENTFDENGEARSVPTVRVFNGENDIPTYIISADYNEETGWEYATVNENGQRGYIKEKKLQEEYGGERRVSLKDYLQERVDGQRAAEEALRMQEEQKARIKAVQQRVMQDPNIDLGTPEAPRPATAVPETANAQGVSVIVNDENGQHAENLSWQQVGNHVGIPVTVKSDAEKDEEMAANMQELYDRKDKYNTIPVGTPINVLEETGEEAPQPHQYRFAKAIYDENEDFVRVYVMDENGEILTDSEGNEFWFPDMAVPELNEVADNVAAQKAAEASAPVAVEEEEPAVEVGNLVEQYTDPQTGVVDQDAFLKDNPAGWAQWNDARLQDGGADSAQAIGAAIKSLDKQISEVDKQLENEASPGVRDNLRGTKDELVSRREKLTPILDGYMQQAEEVAEENAEIPMEAEAETPAAIAENVEVGQGISVPSTAEEIITAGQQAIDDISGQIQNAQTQEERDNLMQAKAIVMQDMVNALGARNAVVTTMGNLVGAMKAAGSSQRTLDQVDYQLGELKKNGGTMEGFYAPDTDTVFMIADGLPTAEYANRINVHEEKHMENKRTKAHRIALSTGVSREELLSVMRNYKNTNEYNRNTNAALADEVLAVSAEIAEESGVESIPDRLRELGVVNEDFINFVQNNIDNGRRNGQRRHLGQRDALQRENSEEGGGQDGRDRVEEPGDVGGSELRPDGRGEEGAGEGESAEPAGESEPAVSQSGLSPDQEAVIAEHELAKEGVASNEEESRFSVRYVPEEDKIDGIAEDISRLLGIPKDKALRWVQSETSLAPIILDEHNSPFLNYEADERYTAIKEDSDYPQGTVDFNNICRKRIAFTNVFQRLQRDFPNTVITGTDLAKIRQIMKDNGYTVACGLCYVEDRRQLLGEIARFFIEEMQSGFDGYIHGRTIRVSAKENVSPDKAKKAATLMKLIGNDVKEDLNIYDLITLEGSDKLQKEHPGIYAAFQRFNAYRGQQAGNLFQGYAEYKREIQYWTDDKVAEVNALGGLRIFSYSDFEAHHLIDLVQIIQDCAKRGVMIQGYTKVPAFARAVANTNIKLNRSLIPLGDTGIVDGQLSFDTVEGIDTNDPDFIESNDNVGNILVGINDEQIRLAMADPSIHYIIPYHSNQDGILRTLKQTGAWTNYKNEQTEKGEGAGKHGVNIYTDVLAAAESEGNPITNEREFVERFLAVCAERGWTPRFSRFLDTDEAGNYVYTPGYYKLLLDFKMFDEEGNILPQKPVVAEFDDAFNQKILQDYVRDAQTENNVVSDDVYEEVVDALDLQIREAPQLTDAQQKVFAFLNGEQEKETKAEEEAIRPSIVGIDELEREGIVVDNEDMLKEYGLSHLTMTKKGDLVTLNKIVAENQGQGAGTKFMNDLAAAADEKNWRLALTPDDSFGATSINRLKNFYKRFGFKPNKGRNADLTVNESMIREPKDVAFSIAAQENEETDKIFNAAKNYFGTTNDFREAGYIMPDGSMLDFSGRHMLGEGTDDSFLKGRRTTDHREVEALAYEKDGNTPTDIETDMADFVGRGAIRIDDNAGAINLATKPTLDQQYKISRIVERNRGDVQVDFSDGWDTACYVEYDGAKPARVINDIKRYFDEGAIPVNGIQYSIRGAIGAAEDDAEAMQNLITAMDMEKDGKDAKTIWQATGWEKGKDGRWRNEIPDAKVKEGGITSNKVKTEDIIEAPEIFESYPQIKDYPVEIKRMKDSVGRYNPNTKTFELHPDYCLSADKKSLNTGNGISTMQHEIQHAIQDIEGFAVGGSSARMQYEYVKSRLMDKPKEATFAWYFKGNSAAKLIRAGKDRLVKIIENAIPKYGPKDQQWLTDLKDYLEGLDSFQYAKLVRDSMALLKKSKKEGEKQYNALAGEVEARNVEKRYRMSDEERSQTPPSETEDVAREEQIVRFSLVKDPLKIAELEAGEKMVGYRNTTLNEDGSLGSPVADRLGKPGESKTIAKPTEPFRLHQWEQSEENPDLASDDGKISVYKPNGKKMGDLNYNPYIHIRPTMLNKQFTSAWSRPELVYIATEYPASELESGYHAEKAVLSTGRHEWNGGDLILSRYDKPSRVVPWEEVAYDWVEEYQDSGVTFDIVPPGLLPVLANRGVEILPPKSAAGPKAMEAYNAWKSEQEPKAEMADPYVPEEGNSELVADESQTAEKLLDMYDNQDGSAEYPWIESGEDFFTYVERDLPYTVKTKPVFSLIDEWRRLDEEDFNEGRRDFSGGEKEQVFEQIMDALRQLAEDKQIADDVRYSVSNKNQAIFVSNAERAVEGIRQEKATPEQWLKMIEKNGGLKAGEDKWLGLSDWLKASDKKTLTKQEVLDFIDQNKIQIEETNYTETIDGIRMNDVHPRFEEAFVPEEDNFRGDIVWEVSDEDAAMEVYHDMTGKTVDLDTNGELDYRNGIKVLEKFANNEFKKAKKKVNIINSTRIQYTTDGLENKQEIALTVPTIEPWNESDEIHFGDAGQGRAIAWVRFGDAQMSADDFEEKKAAYEEAARRLDHLRHELFGKYNEEAEHEQKAWWELATPEEKDELDAVKADERAKYQDYMNARYNYKKVLFIDEIQSKRHQEGREKGYREGNLGELQMQSWQKAESARAFADEMIAKYGIPAGTTVEGVLMNLNSVGNADDYNKLAELVQERNEAFVEQQELKKAIPPAPFEKNWHELAMKRMLRYAAENGYDSVAWTTGEQQAERYGLSNQVSKIEISRDSRSTEEKPLYEVFTYNAANNVIDSASGMFNSERLGEMFGKELATRLAKSADEKNGELATIEGENLRVGGEGMRGFYDEMLPRFVDKYAKKWNTKTSDQLVTLSDGAMLDAHVLPVTQEMKDSVMEGQVMFSVAAEEQQDRQRLIGAAEQGGLAAVLGDEGRADLYRTAYLSIPDNVLRPVVESGIGDMDLRGHVRQYIHDLARKGTEEDETGLLFKMYDDVRFMTGNPALTDADIRWMIWKDTSDAKDGDLLAQAEDMAMRNRWGVGEPIPEQVFKESVEEAVKSAEEAVEDAAKAVETEEKELKDTQTYLKHMAKDAWKDSVYERINSITKAMAAQKEYDKSTVDSIVRFAKDLLKSGNVSDMSRREVSRLLTLIGNTTGKSPKMVKKYADELMDDMLDHVVADEEERFSKLIRTKATKINQSGVEVQAKLDKIGQAILKEFRDYMNATVKTITDRLEAISENLDSEDDTVRADALMQYRALQLALQYKESINENIENYTNLSREFKDTEKGLSEIIGRKGYEQYVASTKSAMRGMLMERIDMYRDLSDRLTELINGSAKSAAAFRKEEKQRIEDIHHDANRDMQGTPEYEHLEENAWQRFLNSDFVRFFLKSLSTADQMFRTLGRKSVTGEGYLFNRYIKNGFIPASEKASRGFFEATKILDEKAAEVFGDGVKKWSDLYKYSRRKGATVTFLDGGEMREHDLSQGNLLYIYMADKMVDGKMKLRRMGIEENDVEAIKKSLDPRFVELADWMQEEFYVNLRNKYNEVHERMFGAPMAAIDDYVPLKILKNARYQDVDTGKQTEAELSSVVTGSIIKRRRNSLALDVLHTDAFSLAIEHVQQMEDWAAFAELRRDMNTLLSYKHFRNQVQNMNTVYGSGEKLWKNFSSVCTVLMGNYRPKVNADDIDTMALNVAKGVTAAKIAFRVNTAIKQLLSFPAYLPDARTDYLIKSMATPGASWKWCMENLPLFEKRWKSRIAGDTRLLDTDSDWKFWRNNIVKEASRLGMTPNAFVDATTVAIGAKAMYDTKKAQYLKDGYSEEKADEMAKRDAEILYNQTQQSSENAFVSPVQLDRTVLAVTLTTYRNSSMAYQRQLHDAIRTLGRLAKPGDRARSIAFMKNQGINEGLSEEEAQKAAERQYNRQYYRSLVRVAIFGYGLQFLWKIGNDMWYLLFGDDDDEKQKILEEAALSELAAPVEGLVGGNVISDSWGTKVTEMVEEKSGAKKGSRLDKYGLAQLPLVSDMKNILNEMGYDKMRAINDIINLVVQSGVGVNPQTITDAVVAAIDYANGDLDEAKNIALAVMRIAQIPQSTIEKFLIDELDLEAENREEEIYKMAKRYALYKFMKNAPLTNKLYDDATRKKRLRSYEESFVKDVNARAKLKGLEPVNMPPREKDAPETPEDIYKEIEKESKALQTKYNAAKKNNDAKTVEYIESLPEFQQYLVWKKHQKGINKLNKDIKNTQDDDFRQKWEAQLRDSIQAVINELPKTE